MIINTASHRSPRDVYAYLYCFKQFILYSANNGYKIKLYFTYYVYRKLYCLMQKADTYMVRVGKKSEKVASNIYKH